MNPGHRLAQWFAAEFGGTQCGDITRRDFSSPVQVSHHVAGDGTARCIALAERLTRKVREVAALAGAAKDLPPPRHAQPRNNGAGSE